VPLYRALPATLKPALHRAMRRFLLDKRFVGCDGFEITDEVRHIIAAQACLLVCRREHAQFDGFTSVLVYPDAVVVDVVDHDGEVEIVSEQTRAGESWAGGPVILSWADVEAGLDVPNDGYNVVLHEFAHKLDEENETGEGLPLLWDAAQLASWAQVLGREFAALSRGEGELLDDYGAVSPAEFFAVVTEHFFEQGAALAAGHPALYAEFRRYYGLDTASWPLSRAFA
jgi:Mlc titration factor MtfA (ptsG expression regulator)